VGNQFIVAHHTHLSGSNLLEKPIAPSYNYFPAGLFFWVSTPSQTETALEQSFEEIYQGNLDESMKVSILEFFMEKKPEKVQALLTLVPADQFSPDLRGHIELVQSSAKQRLQAQDPSRDATSSSSQ